MNNQEIVADMIAFIVEKEQQLQRSKLLADQQAKNDTIRAILDKLEAEVSENQ